MSEHHPSPQAAAPELAAAPGLPGSEAVEGGKQARLPRVRVAILAAVHASLFGLAARVLPWDSATSFGLTAGVLSLGYAALCVACLVRLTWVAPAWRFVSYLALFMLALWSYWTLSAGAYLISLYGGLGQGLAAAAAAAFAPVVLFTLPFAAWGIAATRAAPAPTRTRAAMRVAGKGAGLASVLVISCLGLGHAYASAWSETRALPATDELDESQDLLAAALRAELVDLDQLGPGNAGARIYVHHGFVCAEAVAETNLATALIVFQDTSDPQGRKSSGRCVQAPADELIVEINKVIGAHARQAQIKIDFIRAVRTLVAAHPTVDGLKLRPGLDGVCRGDRCLAPWQLVAHDQFTRFTPIPFIADLKVGTATGPLLAALEPGAVVDGETAGPPISEFTAIEVDSFVVGRHGEVTRLVRGHPLPQPPEQLASEAGAAKVAGAVTAAAKYINASQAKSGRFRYKLDPYSGKKDDRGFNLPRQAGTTFALCEHASQHKRAREVVDRSLRMMSRHARQHGERSFLTKNKKDKRAGLGATALPLIAFASCRDIAGSRHDRLIGDMARALLSLQDERGVFAVKFDRKMERPLTGSETLFAEGQAIFALSLLERLMLEGKGAASWPSAQRLHEAVERSMSHYAEDYWDHPLAQFFWIEENWHCLAARASLEHHRHDGYERFCLDYNRYKLRLALDEQSEVSAEFRGAYGFGNVVAPHNTATAGLGEGLAAAIEIAHRRGEDSAQLRASMRGVQAFLLAQQWRGDEAFALRRAPSAIGGWSESMVSPTIRIDYVQHAMAALASGQKAIELVEASSSQ